MSDNCNGTCGEPHRMMREKTTSLCKSMEKFVPTSTFRWTIGILITVLLATATVYAAMTDGKVDGVKSGYERTVITIQAQNDTLIQKVDHLVEIVGDLRVEVNDVATGLNAEIERSKEADSRCFEHIRRHHTP